MRLDLRPDETRAGWARAIPPKVAVSIAAAAAVAGVLACVGVRVHGAAVRENASELRARADAAQREVAMAESRVDEVNELWDRVERVSVSRSAVPASGVLAAIAEAADQSFTLSRLTLTARAVSGGGPQPLAIEVEGHADSAKDASTVLERLSANPGFSEVRLVGVQEKSGPSGPEQRCVLAAAVRPRLVVFVRHGGGDDGR